MRPERDFHLTIERGERLLLDATSAVRCALYGQLPAPHYRLTQRALSNMARAQRDLHTALTDPWNAPCPEPNPQLALLP